MDSIVAEIIKIIRDAEDSISREESLKFYFENLQCRCVSEALEQIDVELAAAYGKDGWHVEHLDRRTLQASYGTISIRRRRMEKEGEEGIYPLDKELGITLRCLKLRFMVKYLYIIERSRPWPNLHPKPYTMPPARRYSPRKVSSPISSKPAWKNTRICL